MRLFTKAFLGFVLIGSLVFFEARAAADEPTVSTTTTQVATTTTAPATTTTTTKPTTTPTPPSTVAKKIVPTTLPQVSAACPQEGCKQYIYNHESGNNPANVNGGGCYGLGQRCNDDDLKIACPLWQTDYACQDNWWSTVYLGKYGTWEAAYAFWIRTDCRPYCGHWW